MNQEQLNAIKERVAKATPGPWESEGTLEGHNDIFNPDEAYVVCQTGNENYDCLNDDDTEFIKHAITDVPALITEIERLQVELSNAKEYNERLCEVVKEFIDYWATTNDARPLLEIVTDARQALGGEAHE